MNEILEQPEEAVVAPRIAVIRTSDRSLFKRCRRKWDFLSGLRKNLTEKDRASYFWIGTGGHFALEDWHGYNYYGHPAEAFDAYVRAYQQLEKNSSHRLPSDWQEQTYLAKGILDNYLLWCKTRDPYETVWIDGEPQVEITGHLELPINPPPGYDKVVYQFTLDRLCIVDDEFWIQDWKFYKNFDSGDLDMNPQMGAYAWIGSAIYDDPIAGAILHEFRKDLPVEPKILGTGKLSSAKHQKTSHGLYRDALIKLYGSVDKAPKANIECLNDLCIRETPDRDDFIRRRRTRRTLEQQQAEGTRILMELEDMLNPDLPLYINQTKDCDWDCAIRDVCVMIERDEDWHSLLDELMISRNEEPENWRQYLT
jgi:hypothetical protein